MFSIFVNIAKWASDSGWARLFGLTAALKIIVVTGLLFLLAPLLKWVMLWGVSQTVDVLNNVAFGTALEPVAYQMTGLGAWFFDRFRMVECFTILTGAYMIRFAMSPFRKG